MRSETDKTLPVNAKRQNNNNNKGQLTTFLCEVENKFTWIMIMT